MSDETQWNEFLIALTNHAFENSPGEGRRVQRKPRKPSPQLRPQEYTIMTAADSMREPEESQPEGRRTATTD